MRPSIEEINAEILSPIDLLTLTAISGPNCKTLHGDLLCRKALKYRYVETSEIIGVEILNLHCYPKVELAELVKSLKIRLEAAHNLNYNLEKASKNPEAVYWLINSIDSYGTNDDLFCYSNWFLDNLRLFYERDDLLAKISATVLGNQSLRISDGPLSSFIQVIDELVEKECDNALYNSGKNVRYILQCIGTGMDNDEVLATAFRGTYNAFEIMVNTSYVRNSRAELNKFISGKDQNVTFFQNVPIEFECWARTYGKQCYDEDFSLITISLPDKLVELINICESKLLRNAIVEPLDHVKAPQN
jgi:hypothetical protein